MLNTLKLRVFVASLAETQTSVESEEKWNAEVHSTIEQGNSTRSDVNRINFDSREFDLWSCSTLRKILETDAATI
jgi:hypothetical protein